MSAWEQLVVSLAAGTGAAATAAGLVRRYLRQAVAAAVRRPAIRRALQDAVDEAAADLIVRQAQFETRQGRHLDAQDVRLARIERKIDQAGGGGCGLSGLADRRDAG